MIASMMAGRSVAANAAAAPADNEVTFTRVIDAPRELVFKVWTEPEHIVAWWRPRHFAKVTLEEMNVRPGGELRFRMHAPDGTQFVSSSVYREVSRPERLVYLETCHENERLFHRTLQTVSFDDHAGATRLHIHSSFEWISDRAAHWTPVFMRQMWTEGWKDNGELLAEYLAALRADQH